MRRNILTALLAVALAGLTWGATAESTELAINPTGTWQLTTGSSTNIPQTLKLKVVEGKLTGTLSRQAGYRVEQLPLLQAKLQGNQVSFETHNYAVSYINNVLQPTDTNKWSHSKFQGTVNGDTIKGKVERDSFMGNKRTMDFEAKRVR